uniref:Uncharacterized protein n=1 Tax=Aegilops tauschii subsp. strangulata TaxID=200361 RepID=A0A453HUM4_AEGTS
MRSKKKCENVVTDVKKVNISFSWSMMAFLLIFTIGSLYEWKRGASDRE